MLFLLTVAELSITIGHIYVIIHCQEYVCAVVMPCHDSTSPKVDISVNVLLALNCGEFHPMIFRLRHLVYARCICISTMSFFWR